MTGDVDLKKLQEQIDGLTNSSRCPCDVYPWYPLYPMPCCPGCGRPIPYWPMPYYHPLQPYWSINPDGTAITWKYTYDNGTADAEKGGSDV